MRPTRRHAVCFLAAVALFVALPQTIHLLCAQPAKPAPLADEEETFEPGLKLTITSGDATDSRVARMIALYVPKGTPPSAFIGPGPFQATWDGIATTKIRDEYVLTAHGRGSIKVMFGDQCALDANGDDLSTQSSKPIQLPKGKNAIRIEYKSPADGDAWVRLYWTAKGSIPEPINPSLLTHNASDKPLREISRVHHGRELFVNLRCQNCHAPDIKPDAGAMPKLSIDAPSLLDVGARLNPAWMAKWISDPHALRSDATMPHLPQAKEKAADIAAYLATLGKTSEAPRADGDPIFGARIVAGLGCLTCHMLPGAEPTPDGPPRVSLAHVKEKFKPAALREYLMNPEKRYRWTRMPNFKLTEKEAADVQTFLFSKAPSAENPSNSGDEKRGRESFSSAGCLSCHDVGSQPSTFTAPTLAKVMSGDWTKGCLAPDDAARGLAPDFKLDDTSRTALTAFAAAGTASLQRDTSIEFAQRQYTALNCRACHNRDREQSLWFTLTPEIDGLEATLPPEAEGKGVGGAEVTGTQARPVLTFVGEKLRPQWTSKFIAGELAYKPRPWLRARMPSFPARASGLAAGLAMEQGFSPVAPDQPPPDPAQTAIGQKLVGRNGGFSCINCHAAGSLKALQPFEAPAPNFIYTTERLRKDFYHRWVRNPLKIDPGTKMPQFADGEGKTALKDILDGDAVKQYEAIWQYLLQGEKLTPPE